MHRTLRIALLAAFALCPLLAQEGIHSSTVTFSAGGGQPIAAPFGSEGSGPAFAGNYEFRILKYLAVEAGVETLLPKATSYELLPVFIPPGQALTSFLSSTSPTSYCSSGCVSIAQQYRTRATLIPFGVKGILPLWRDRVELFAGLGGAYDFQADYRYLNGMLAQGSIGGRIALDRHRRFWLGTSGRFLSDWGSGRQSWATGSTDLGIRF